LSRRTHTLPLSLSVAALLAGLVSVCLAEIPQLINYQVMLTNETGEPLADQAVDLDFSLWTEAGSGSNEWSESHIDTTNSIGVVSVVLGSSTPLSSVDFSVPLWLQIEVNGEPLSPRRELVASPYTMCAADIENVGDFAGVGLEEDGSNRLKLTSDYETGMIYDGRFVNEVDMPVVVRSIAGVTNDGGDIDVVGGTNVTVTPNDDTNTITISATGGGDDGDWTISGDDVYRSAGRVGVGTASPMSRLHVNSDGASLAYIRITNGSTGDSGLRIGLNGPGLPYIVDDTGHGLRINSAMTVSPTFIDARDAGLKVDRVSVVTGAGEGLVLTSDAQGDASWQPVPAPVSIAGVANDGGDIALAAGTNISITPNDETDTITISATGGGDDGDWTVSGGDVYRGTGYVGVGTSTPMTTLDVESTGNIAGRFESNSVADSVHVLHAEYTGTGNEFHDPVAVYGKAVLENGVGYGGWFEGGYIGVEGYSSGETESQTGVHGVSRGTPNATINKGVYGRGMDGWYNYGVYGWASSNDPNATNYGVYGRATGVAYESYAGYFDGDVEVTENIRVAGFEMGTGGSEGYVLTSDGMGVGTWEPVLDDGDWVASGDDIYHEMGSVGIGSSVVNPNFTLGVQGNFQVMSNHSDDLAQEVGSLMFTGLSGASFLSDSHLVAMYSMNDLKMEADILALFAGENSNASSQFIECSRFAAVEDREFRVDLNGEVYADGDFHAMGADFAEMLRVNEDAGEARAGDVMVIDVSGDRGVAVSTTARSSLVAGVYSTDPAFVASKRDWDEGSMSEMKRLHGEIPLAVVGVVPCRVSAENGPIHRGDLLVTSSTAGHAMREDDPRAGTILGKALGSLDSGTGSIEVLVTLQ
jgi:hypothetical protein